MSTLLIKIIYCRHTVSRIGWQWELISCVFHYLINDYRHNRVEYIVHRFNKIDIHSNSIISTQEYMSAAKHILDCIRLIIAEAYC